MNKYKYDHILILVVVRKPKECMVCGSLGCESCLKCWSESNRKFFV